MTDVLDWFLGLFAYYLITTIISTSVGQLVKPSRISFRLLTKRIEKLNDRLMKTL